MSRQVSPQQLELLLDFLDKHQFLATGKVRGKEGNALSNKLWKQFATILNADETGLNKSGTEWKIYFNQYKSRAKGKRRIIEQRLAANGAGIGPIPTLTPLEERLMGILGENSSSPLPVGHSHHSRMTSPESEESSCDGKEKYIGDIVVVKQEVTGPPDSENGEVLPDTAVPSYSESGAAGIKRDPLRERIERSHYMRRYPRPVFHRGNKQSELKAIKQRLAAMEQSRLEVDRQLTQALNRNASAMEAIAEAANRFVDMYEERQGRRRRRSNASIGSGE